MLFLMTSHHSKYLLNDKRPFPFRKQTHYLNFVKNIEE